MRENTIGRALRAPWVVLRVGGVTLVLYVVLGVFLISVLSDLSMEWLFSVIYDSSIELQLSDWSVAALNVAAKALVYFLSIPIYLTIFSLPVRLIAIHGRLPLRDLFEISLTSFRLGAKAITLSLSTAFFLVLPLLGMIIFYQAMLGRIESPLFLRIYPVVCALLSLPILYKTTSLIGAPIISIVGQLDSFIAVRDCRIILAGFKIEFFSILIAILAIYSGFDFLLTELNISVSSVELAKMLLVPTIGWLACVMISWIVVESFWKAAENREQQSMPHMRNATPAASVHASPAQASSSGVTVESNQEASSLSEAEREIFIHVQNLHLHKK